MRVAPHAPPQRRHEDAIGAALERSPLGPEFGANGPDPTRTVARELALVWSDFLKRLEAVPIIAAIEDGSIRRDEYKLLLLNLRQQVVDGGRWIALAASSMSQELFPVRSALIMHAAEEHRDYRMLEENYVALGGSLEEIGKQPKNVGTEALSAFMFREASRPDPVHLFGAMFIIEGLGAQKAGLWARRLAEHLGLQPEHVSFLAYHGQNDDAHYEKLKAILSAPFITESVAGRIVRTARIVGRLYVLQMEELGNS